MLLTKNDLRHGLANGSRGVVTSFQVQPEEQPLAGPGIGHAPNASLNWKLPVVRFDSGLEITVHAQDFFQPGGGGGGMRRKQLPLRLGWAVTVHRAQGCTLARAELQVDDAFDYGQARDLLLSHVTSTLTRNPKS